MGKTSGASRRVERATRPPSALVEAAPYEIGDLLNIAGHELRAPLTPLKIRLQMARSRLQREGGRERDVDDLSKALYHVERMQQYVTLLLDAYSLMNGSLTLTPRLRDLSEVARRLTGIYANADTTRAIRLEDTDEPLTGLWDDAHLEVALRELIGNALKYTTGDITFRLARQEAFARVEVEDAGPAIPASIRDRVFEPYVTGSQNNHGLGLGLYVAREIIRLHGGELGMRSSDTGGGSLFWLTLPVGPAMDLNQRN